MHMLMIDLSNVGPVSNIHCSKVITETADGLAPNGTRPSAGTALIT